MSEATLQAALPFIAWSRLFNLNVSTGDADDAWQSLNLPGTASEFVAALRDLLSRRVSLDVSDYVPGGGATVGEELCDIRDRLDLPWDGVRLPQEHVAAVTEILACAIERDEAEAVTVLCQRLLLPWCERAEAAALREQPTLGFLFEDFAQDLVDAGKQAASGER